MKLLATGSNPTNITTTPPALAVNTCPTNAKSFELQGRSLVLNQLVQNGNFVNGDNWGHGGFYSSSYSYANNTVTITANDTGFDITQLLASPLQTNHKYYFTMDATTTSAVNIQARFAGVTNQVVVDTTCETSFATFDTIFTSSYDNTRLLIYSGVLASSQTAQLQKIMLIDLTQTFGAGLEPTTVDQVQSIIDFSKYIPFNPGTFIHNNSTYEVNRFNQLVANGDFSNGTTGWNQISTFSTWNVTNNVLSASWSASYSNNGFRPTSVVLISGHKYCATATIKNTGASELRFYVGQPYDMSNASVNSLIASNATITLSGIITPTTVEESGYYFSIFAPYNTSPSIEVSNVMCIDVTDIFSAGKEPSTIDECKLRFLAMGIDITKYQPYSPLGSNLGGKVDLGFNIWDEEWELGTISSTTGQNASSSSLIRSKNYISVMPNQDYHLTASGGLGSGAAIFLYDASKNFIEFLDDQNNQTFNVGNACYIRFIKVGTTYNHDICINESQPDTTKSPHNGDYRPYLMLRGIGSDFNVWDEEWYANDWGYIYNKNAIKVIPGATYYLKVGTSSMSTFRAVDENNTHIRSLEYSIANRTVTIPSDVKYVGFTLNSAYGSTYKNDICINLSQPQTTINPHNGQYVPHLFDTYDSMSGILTRRLGVVDLGTLSWNGWGSTSSYDRYVTEGIDTLVPSNARVLCTMFASKQSSESITPNMVWVSSGSAKLSVATTVGAYTDATTFKAAMNGVMLLYELVTSTVETTIIQPISFVVSKLGKQYGVVDLGSLNWTYDNGGFFKVILADHTKAPTTATIGDMFCAKYKTVAQSVWASSGNCLWDYTSSSSYYICIVDIVFTDAIAFKNSLQGQYLIYRLADSAINPTYATAGNLIQKTKGDIGDVDFNLKYWQMKDIKLLKAGKKFLSVND